MTNLRERLSAQIDVTSWADLSPHSKREALFIVAEALDLVEVAVAIASDDAGVVEGWIAGGQLSRPSPEQQSRWADHPDRPFRCVIVQPFVLAQCERPH